MDSLATDNKDGSTDATTFDVGSEISIRMPDPSEGRRCIVKSSRTTLARIGITGSTALDEKRTGQWLEERCRDKVEDDMNDHLALSST